jgi:hypothetical protein
MSATGGTAGYSPGTGEGVPTKTAYNPNKKADGTANNYYTKKLGFKPVDRSQAKHSKVMDYKNLWT